MKFLQALIRALTLMAKQAAGFLLSFGAHPASAPELELPEDPMVAKANREIDMLRRAGDLPGHSLQGPAHVANLLRCYAMADEERRPFMTLRGVPPAQIGWLKSLDGAGLARLATANHEAIWTHLKGGHEIPGLPSFTGRTEAHWLRAKPFAGSNVVEIQEHRPISASRQAASEEAQPRPSIRAFG
ncbi:hypothetical protein [Methylobacterium oryzae]|uniref:Uncharacterized protein n=1 Tax=Methylobacterium oryzae TaxID=334852 RepID=A0ABU7TYA5_9HYPH